MAQIVSFVFYDYSHQDLPIERLTHHLVTKFRTAQQIWRGQVLLSTLDNVMFYNVFTETETIFDRVVHAWTHVPVVQLRNGNIILATGSSENQVFNARGEFIQNFESNCFEMIELLNGNLLQMSAAELKITSASNNTTIKSIPSDHSYWVTQLPTGQILGKSSTGFAIFDLEMNCIKQVPVGSEITSCCPGVNGQIVWLEKATNIHVCNGDFEDIQVYEFEELLRSIKVTHSGYIIALSASGRKISIVSPNGNRSDLVLIKSIKREPVEVEHDKIGFVVKKEFHLLNVRTMEEKIFKLPKGKIFLRCVPY
jgi:hypothetical protein